MKQWMLKIPYGNSETEKACFEAWFETGSLKRAQQKLKEDGVLSARGKPFASADSVRKSSIRYMTTHYEETKQMLLEQYKKNGYAVEEQYIEQYLIGMAVQALVTRERVKFWLVKNDLLEKHKNFIGSLIELE